MTFQLAKGRHAYEINARDASLSDNLKYFWLLLKFPAKVGKGLHGKPRDEIIGLYWLLSG